MTAIFLPGVEIRGDSARTGYMLSMVEGLTSSPAPRIEGEVRANGHGEYGQELIWSSARQVTVVGGYGGPDQFAAGDVLKRLVGQHFEAVFVLPHGTFRGQAYFGSQVRWMPVGVDSADFEFTLKLDDPRLYGALQSVSTGVPSDGEGIADPLDDPVSEGAPGNPGRVTVINDGTASAEPTITVTGGLEGGFELRYLERGLVIRVTRPILDGSQVSVDCSTGEIWVDNQSILPASFIPLAEWFQVPAGETCTIQWAPLGGVTGSPQMQVEFAGATW